MIEEIIKTRTVKHINDRTFEPTIIVLKGELSFVVGETVSIPSMENNPMTYVPVDLFEDGILVGTIKYGTMHYKGVVSHPVAFSLPNSIVSN